MAFLIFNFQPAKIFMGDTGSLFIGGTLGVVAICCKQELLQIVAADRQKIDPGQQLRQLPEQRRHLHHRADPDFAWRRDVAPRLALHLKVEQSFAGIEPGGNGATGQRGRRCRARLVE